MMFGFGIPSRYLLLFLLGKIYPDAALRGISRGPLGVAFLDGDSINRYLVSVTISMGYVSVYAIGISL